MNSKKPIEEESKNENKIETKMVATVSTETLKPASLDEKKSKKKIKPDEDKGESSRMTRKVKSSSSSETESASSGDESSTDTG